MPRNDKWKGAAAWSAKEARAGDRLPYVRLIDENTLLLRDGSVMTAIQVPGLLFETEDSEALNAHAATREVVLRSTLDARFVLYHHVIRRRVSVELEAEFPDPISRHIDERWSERLGSGQLFKAISFQKLLKSTKLSTLNNSSLVSISSGLRELNDITPPKASLP